jgi:hypothetical protein
VTIAEEVEQNGIAGFVCVSAATMRECEGLFDVEKLEPIVLHAKPTKNILPGEAASAAAAASGGKDKSAAAASVDALHLQLDGPRLIHRYKVLGPLCDMSGHAHRGGHHPGPVTVNGHGVMSHTDDPALGSKSRALLMSADGSPLGAHGDAAGGAAGDGRGSRSRPGSRPGSAVRRGLASISASRGQPSDDFDRAPPPFVTQILARINAKNFQDAHARAERQDAKIQAALQVAQHKADSNPARTYHPSQFAVAAPGLASPNTPVIVHSPPNGVH